ncbi:putative 4,5-dihydroxyphthalate decarboxylase [Dinoroseobacter shibae DFL 12 = DSM 16493]|uniref:Putative 4,5-dihydroxyphthalate decarboxylase n=3 Tax=Pseudomonadota TaxID=1224 RepID=A8LSS1_DINSH|nr:putative 4,5-dihydroxyphthalate decarboxylase [Dinoroseobacter shibae]ABV94270.1 putative 4,5-dihydroxyphthalate decarboxylase [Dinoroseobacter shibae DFL 12 = DSM 16493]URF45707.1 4,5-dihydroxyphthalate decarboxylase [Dinoroseobacter shibae]URF50012.1 4,5-dihydroxyphthalate decarboxylase [Dinoroseobacter shibae]
MDQADRTAPGTSAQGLSLSLASWDHDRVMALHDGRVRVPGVALRGTVAPTSELFPRAVGDAPYDITEMSISSYVLQVSRGVGAYVAIPAFVSRAFRHAGFFARAGSGIETPADFAGRRIGVPEYQMTAALWMRGILADEYGVAARQVHWRTGALDAGVRRERLELELPEGMRVEPISEGETLQDLLLAGEIDGLLAPKPPNAFLAGDARFVRLFPDFEAAERAYHAKTGFFPIMHLIGVRKSLVDAHPWLPRALYDGFVEARDMALQRLRSVWLGNANRLSLPWLGATMERTISALGPDYWSYGYRANREELAAVCRYSVEQHLAARAVQPEDLFHPSVLET